MWDQKGQLTAEPRAGSTHDWLLPLKTNYLSARQVVSRCHASQVVVTAITSGGKEIDSGQGIQLDRLNLTGQACPPSFAHVEPAPSNASNRVADSRGSELGHVGLLRFALLFGLFFVIAFGLGYPTLNRYDPRAVPGLIDVKSYAAIVTGAPVPGHEHLRFRVLVPWVARPFYRVAEGRLHTWDPVMFGLLSSDSLFVAATALLIVVLGTRHLGSYALSLVASLLYLVNFAVPNLRLVGLVDAGEGFFLLAFLWSVAQLQLWWLPLIAALGALSKESFIPFSIVFTATWWLVVRKSLRSQRESAAWIATSWIVSLAVLVGLHWKIAGLLESPMQFAARLRGNGQYFSQFASSLWDHNFWYVFVWLLPAGIPRLKNFPKSWLIPIAATSITAFVLDAYYSGAPGTVGRALFSIAGPLLALSAALLLLGRNGLLHSLQNEPRRAIQTDLPG